MPFKKFRGWPHSGLSEIKGQHLKVNMASSLKFRHGQNFNFMSNTENFCFVKLMIAFTWNIAWTYSIYQRSTNFTTRWTFWQHVNNIIRDYKTNVSLWCMCVILLLSVWMFKCLCCLQGLENTVTHLPDMGWFYKLVSINSQ